MKTYGKYFVLCLFLTLSLSVNAQSEKKEGNQDLRSSDQQFALIVVKNESNNVRLLRNNMKEFVLLFGQGEKQVRLRLSTERMREVDTEFVQKYFLVNFVLGKAQKKCTEAYQLILRGEKVSICDSEEKKVVEAKKLLSFLNGLR